MLMLLCASTTKPDPVMIEHTIQLFVIYKTMSIKLKWLLTYQKKIDQQNLKMKIEAWEEQDKESKFYFRPFVKSENLPEEFIDNRALVQEEFEHLLVRVHQTEWQRDMLIKYGNTMTLMDVTYKVTKYDIPLFFLTVCTNTGYMVVAQF